MGRPGHGPALATSPHAQLAGVWGRAPAKAEKLARELGTRSYDDYDELLGSVDAVAIAVPPDVQALLAVRAARAGRHLLLEKPLALDLAAAEEVVQAVDDAGVASTVFFGARFHPATERWAQDASGAGGWHSAHVIHYYDIFRPESHYRESVWRRERGALWDIAPHALATLIPVMGPVTSVTARRGRAGSDTVHLVVTHGAPVTGGSRPHGPVAASTISLSLTAPQAAAVNQLVLFGEHGVRARPDLKIEAVEAFQVMIAELAELVASGARTHRCDARFGLDVVRIVAAAERALEIPPVEVIAD